MLPDDVLGRILAKVWEVNASGVANPALVSRRWRRVFFSEPGIWRRTSTVLPNHIGPAGFAVEIAMLQRVATLVHSLVATQREGLEGTSPAAGEQLAATLRVLRAAPATRLALDWTDGGLPAQACCPGYLGQLTGLTELSLRSVRLPAEAASALCSLTGLLDLSVEARLIPKALLNEALPRLTRLTRLHLGSSLLLPSLPQIDALRMLRHLALLEDSEEFVEQPWTAAELVEDLRWRQLAGEHRLAPLRLPPSPSLPALSFFYFFSSGRATRRALQVAPGVELEFCRYEQGQRAAGGASGARGSEGGAESGADMVPYQALHIMGAGVGSLAKVLDVLLQPGMPLEVLSLYSCSPGPVQLEACAARLASLRTLRLDNICSDGGWHASARALLAAAPSLRSLHLAWCDFDDGVPPSWLVQRSGLEHLVMRGCCLTNLPPGPYLQGLSELVVTANPIRRLPRALMLASALEHLCIGAPGDGLQLAAEDLAVLAALPRLQRLSTASCTPGSRMWRALRRALPRLELAQPPALGAAS